VTMLNQRIQIQIDRRRVIALRNNGKPVFLALD
jgi:hypothetical protein